MQQKANYNYYTIYCNKIKGITMKQTEVRTAVIYARYSSDNQREESIEGQLRECYKYAKINNIEIIDEYIDRAKSATTDNRPAFQKMIDDVMYSKCNAVIVYQFDRFSRNMMDSLSYKLKLKKKGITVLSTKENIPDGAVGKLLENFIDSLSGYYSDDLKVKIKRGIYENALKGRGNGGKLPLGYIYNEDKQYTIEPKEAEVVRFIFNEYARGVPISELLMVLREKGVKSRSNKIITNSSLHRILHNVKYMGYYTYEDIVFNIPQIIDENTFNEAQKMLSKNKPKNFNNENTEKTEYYLTGRIFCSCGNRMSGYSYKSGLYLNYRCNGYKDKSCNRIVRKKIEDAVYEEVKKFIYNDKILNELVDELYKLYNAKSDKTVIAQYKKELANANKKIDNLVDLAANGATDKATALKLNSLGEERDRIEELINKETRKKPQLSKEKIIAWFKVNREVIDEKDKQLLISTLVDKVVVNDDDIHIFIKYNNSLNEFVNTSDWWSIRKFSRTYHLNLNNIILQIKNIFYREKVN